MEAELELVLQVDSGGAGLGEFGLEEASSDEASSEAVRSETVRSEAVPAGGARPGDARSEDGRSGGAGAGQARSGGARSGQARPGGARIRADGRVIRVDLRDTDPAGLIPKHLRPLPLLRSTRAFLARSDLELRIEAAGRPLLRLDPALSPGFWGRLLRVPGLRIGPRAFGVWWRSRRRG